jgi:flagellar M-ring protein FliF
MPISISPKVQATRESYPKDTRALREENGTVTNDVPAAATSRRHSRRAFQSGPPAAQLRPHARNSRRGPPTDRRAAPTKTENYNRTFELGREISVTKQPVGRSSG